MSDADGSRKRLVLLIIDTLRADFINLASPGELQNFERLRSLCKVYPTARCGSFPTGPMRTDLLTGRLSFLDAEWALPEKGEKTLPRHLSDAGIRTTLVTDNYVAAIPRLGGMLLNEFDSIDFIRGSGSDPWMTPSRELAAQTVPDTRPPSRSVPYEIQYLANVSGWRAAGGTPTQRLVRSALHQLDVLQTYDQFLLWIDSFSCHEPWAPFDMAAEATLLPDLPLFPGYVESNEFEDHHRETWKRQYIQRIRDTDHELGPLVDALEAPVRQGQTALAVLSDHGFLFGEYGFVGKPANTPLPPELHRIVCWLSPDFAPLLSASEFVQPHLLHHAIRKMFGTAGCAPDPIGLQVFGRNSPRSSYIAAARGDELYVGAKSSNGTAVFSTIRDHDPERPLMCQASEGIPIDVKEHLGRTLSSGRSEWIKPFRDAVDADASKQKPVQDLPQPPRRVDALIICALGVEFDALREALLPGNSQRAMDPRIDLWHFFVTIERMDAIVVQLASPWAGNVVSAGVTASLLPLLDPWLIVSFGIAGTLDPKEVPACDVAFARSVSYIDLRKETESNATITKQIPQLITAPALLNVLEKLKTAGVHQVDMVSSEAVVKSKQAERRKVAAQAVADAKAVEMEAFGVYKASEIDDQYLSHTKRFTVAIKGISDAANLQKNDLMHKDASRRAAAFLRKVLAAPEMRQLRKRSRIATRPLPFRPLWVYLEPDAAVDMFLQIIGEKFDHVSNAALDRNILRGAHLRANRPRIFYHWRITAEGIHWVELYFLRLLRQLGNKGYPIECLITDKVVSKEGIGPHNLAELDVWRETVVRLADLMLAGTEHLITLYSNVIRKEAVLSRYATKSGAGQALVEALANVQRKDGSRIDANLNMQLNLWLRHMAWRSSVEGTCIVLHRPGNDTTYSLLWHFVDLVPDLISTPEMKIAGTMDKPASLEVVLLPPDYSAVMNWLQGQTDPAILKGFLKYIAGTPEEDSERHPATVPEKLGNTDVPEGWRDLSNPATKTANYYKGAIVVELAALTKLLQPSAHPAGE